VTTSAWRWFGSSPQHKWQTSDMKASSQGSRIESLHCLRALACMAVVAFHVFRATIVHATPPANSLFLPSFTAIELMGAMGVDVFFVLSGYLMSHFTRSQEPGPSMAMRFLKDRFVRIWPAYLTISLIAYALLARHGNTPQLIYEVSAERILGLLFWPSYDLTQNLRPIVGPGWTLNYEFFFYICFAMAACIPGKGMLIRLSAIFISAFIAGQLMTAGSRHDFLTNPIIFEFLIGCYLAALQRRGYLNHAKAIHWFAAAALILMALSAGKRPELPHLVYSGLPSALLVAGAIQAQLNFKPPQWVMALGDASYSIYLTHFLLVYEITSRLIPALTKVNSQSATMTASLLTILFCALIGVLFHRHIELPITDKFRAVVNNKKLP
jgi:exopolysaccharide production protein ExoZ